MLDRTTALRAQRKSQGLPRLGALVTMIKVCSIVAGAFGCVSRPTPVAETSSKPSPEHAVPPSSSYSPETRRTLLRLARAALEQAVRQGKHLDPPADMPAGLREKKGSFVTLTKHGQLRGCIGNIYPDLPLVEAVSTNAYRAALNDPRFLPVTSEELSTISVEVSVLSVPHPLAFGSPTELLSKLRPHTDGVVLKVGLRRATFLPQVWEKLPTPSEFLDHLAAKAGLSPQAWREPGTEILIYHVDAFTESEPDAGTSG
jgi:AmmeMemoRadiSam system protein A